MRDNSTQQQPNVTSKWVLVWVLAVAGMLNYAVRTSITAVYPLLKTELGFTDAGLAPGDHFSFGATHLRRHWRGIWATGSIEAALCCGVLSGGVL